MSAFMAAVGKLWGDAGLTDLLVNSGVFGPCTVAQILQGKQFNRGVRAITLVFEVFAEMFLENFLKWQNSRNSIFVLE